MDALPDDVEVYRETRVFTEATVPAGLLRRHTTKPGVWGRIVVLDGALRYRILAPTLEEHLLAPGRPGIIAPAVSHEVATEGAVRFKVQFLRPA